MKQGVAACPKCEAALTSALCNTAAPVECPACEAMIQVEVFPAFFKDASPGQSGEAIVEEGVAGCFYHDQKKAIVHCDACGRFLCSLCDLELEGRHYCSACLESGKRREKMLELVNRRTLYDGAALALVIWPLLVWPLLVFTAPLAIWFAILSFRRPGSIVRRTRWRAIVAIILALAELGGFIAIGYAVFSARA